MQWSFRNPILRGDLRNHKFIETLSELGLAGAELLESYVEEALDPLRETR